MSLKQYGTPKVSVVIPVFNRGNTIKRAISSVLNQTFQDLEIIVVDDGSTDSTKEVVNEIKHDGRIKIIQNSLTKGAQGARITGIKKSSGEWIAFLDSDDELLPDSISFRIAYANQCSKDTVLIYGDLYLYKIGNNSIIEFMKLKGYVYPYLTKELSLCPSSAMMIKKGSYKTTGYPDPKFPAWQDDDMALTIGKYFPIAHCGVPVGILHTGQDNISCDREKVFNGLSLMVNKYKTDIFKYHGYFRLFLWYLRLLNLFFKKKYSTYSCFLSNTADKESVRKYITNRLKFNFFYGGYKLLRTFLTPFFDRMYN